MTEEEDILYGNKDKQPPNPMEVLEELLRMRMKLMGWNDIVLSSSGPPCTGIIHPHPVP